MGVKIIKNNFEEYNIDSEKPKLPVYLQLELTNSCNLRCTGCVHNDRKVRNTTLSLENFEHILKKIPTIEHISFVGAGETLLVEEFDKYISVCNKKNIYTSCTTNGLLLEKQIDKIIKSGLNKLIISVDASDEKTMKNIRPGLDVNILHEILILAAKKTKNKNTNVTASITISKYNIRHLDDIIKFIFSAGISEISIECYHHWGEDTMMNINSLFILPSDYVIEKIRNALNIASQLNLNVSIFNYNKVFNLKFNSSYLCSWPWDSLFITSNGDITPCCINIEKSNANFMGNILQDKLEKIWWGEKYINIRTSLMKNKPWKCCQECIYKLQYGLQRKEDL